MIVGYNDLFHTIGRSGQRVRLQTGEYWDFTCTRKLTGTDDDNGIVDGTTDKPEAENQLVETDFNVDIMCCDPADESCEQVSTLITSLTNICFSVPLTQPLSFALVPKPIRNLHFSSTLILIMMGSSTRMSIYTLINVLIPSMMTMRLKWVRQLYLSKTAVMRLPD